MNDVIYDMKMLSKNILKTIIYLIIMIILSSIIITYITKSISSIIYFLELSIIIPLFCVSINVKNISYILLNAISFWGIIMLFAYFILNKPIYSIYGLYLLLMMISASIAGYLFGSLGKKK